ncbi:glucuronate isomerase [Aquimarina agarivorans]|uniref:glucuronate isomerase n=1 Tax=Aquimarina agarivorans TaxID=980584 RepID=UPI000248EB10|nr:glucuronate isomerase [Aquimarina agarivorans]
MKTFLDANFLLTNKVAEKLYHDIASKMPIIDYHNHLPPNEIANNRQYANISQAWLNEDHYKWRAMRANGIDEHYITRNASDKEKFLKWGATVPYTLRNPLYHWTHLELQGYFDIHELLNKENASSIYEITSAILQKPDMSCQGILKQKNVEALCTTDDPIDDLAHHQFIKKNNAYTKVFPTFRPETAISISDLSYINKLSGVTKINIKSTDDLLEALQQRIDYFHNNGCRLSDISFEKFPELTSEIEAKISFKRFLNKQQLTPKQKENTQAYLLIEVCKLYHKKNWTQQFHIGVVRNNNSRAKNKLGPDTGFDSMSDVLQGHALMHFLDRMDSADQLAKTILYNLNPRDNDLFANAIGNFQGGKIAGKIIPAEKIQL